MLWHFAPCRLLRRSVSTHHPNKNIMTFSSNKAWDVSRARWTDKTVLITGASSGLGRECVSVMASQGPAHVIMACRNTEKAKQVLDQLKLEHADTKFDADIIELDLASLASVREFAEIVKERYSKIDVLMNNAGVMGIPLEHTEDGFEMQMATNHLGHFALTGLLLPLLLASTAKPAFIVNVSSLRHRAGKLDFANLDYRKDPGAYVPIQAYSDSKLANILFTHECVRRLQNLHPNAALKVLSAHPGYSNTQLQWIGPEKTKSRLDYALRCIGSRLVAQSSACGAVPQLYACDSTVDLPNGSYVGPDGWFEISGKGPRLVESSVASHDPLLARKLWKVSESLTGVAFLDDDDDDDHDQEQEEAEAENDEQ